MRKNNIDTHTFWRTMIVCIVIAGISLFTYRFLWDAYYQQDEWLSLGLVMVRGIFSELQQYPVYWYTAGTVRFLGTLSNNILHAVFPFEPRAFAVTGLFLHSLNAVLVALLVIRITKSTLAGFLGGMFFAVSHIHHQALTWFASVTTTLPAALFSLLALHVFFYGLEEKKKAAIVLAQLLLILSFFFKESSIYLFLVFPSISYLRIKKDGWSKKEIFSMFLPTLLYGLYVLCIRFWIVFSPVGRVGMFVTTDDRSVLQIIINGFIYPYLGFSQLFIPPIFIEQIAHVLAKQPLIAQWLQSLSPIGSWHILWIMDILSFVASTALLAVSFLILKMRRYQNMLLLSLTLIFFAFLPHIILKRGYESYLSPRYYYFPSFGGALFIGLLSLTVQKLSSRMRVISAVFLLIFSVYLYKNMSLTRAMLLQQNIEGAERKRILTLIQQTYPTLHEHPVFLITGNSQGYYGIPQQKVPFQQGMGFTLMVLFYQTGSIPKQLVEEWYLWDLRDEGYKEVDGKAFGYTSYPETIRKWVKDKTISSPEQVYAFSFDSTTRKLSNSTNEERNDILPLFGK